MGTGGEEGRRGARSSWVRNIAVARASKGDFVVFL